MLTVACALVGRHVADLGDYRAKKAQRAPSSRSTRRAPSRTRTVDVAVNTADDDTRDGIYLTVTGLSAEAGDDGQVGRGNRVNGLITPYRPMTLEAVAGKNPVSHVGKLYNVIANEIASAVVEEIAGVKEAYCMLVSQIGRPINEPQLLDLKLRLEDAAALETIRPRAAEIAASGVGRVATLWRELIEGRRVVA